MESYKDNMSELFFLQSKGNVVDLPAFRKRPSQQYMNFLKSNNAPQDVLDEVKLAVLGPNAVFEKPNSGITGEYSVTNLGPFWVTLVKNGEFDKNFFVYNFQFRLRHQAKLQ